ncbi:L-asparaginase, partial [Acinetobacter gerneri]
MKVTTLTIFLSSIFLSSNVLAIEQKPSVEIYATGGTIAGSSASNLDTTNYKAGSIGVNDLINAV